MYDSWRGRLYGEREPKRLWLERYAERFDTVEVNATFYRLARESTVAAWVERTPPGFLFAVKASRYLTHVKRLDGIAEGLARFLAPLDPLVESGRLGPILWQLPENFHRDDRRLAGWLSLLGTVAPARHTIEFRHPSWFCPRVLEALRERGVALAIGDHPARPWNLHEATAGWRFVRFHWGARGRRGNYSVSELGRWAERIAGWRAAGEDVYAYFNNDWEGFAPANAVTLRRALERGPGGRPGGNGGQSYRRAGKRRIQKITSPGGA
jgi:uncharacterized protein YecE (DUF72 family)